MAKEEMQPQQHQMMGYDRAITMFSPDGRLLQVEYAKKTVKQGSTAIGIRCKDGVLLIADKRIVDDLIVIESIEKTFMIDNHIAATAAGILSDARVLVERAQLTAQEHKVTYDHPVDVVKIVKDICDLKQVTTQSGGYRPFGVSLLVGGVDDSGSRLYMTDPTGIFFEYKATSIGEGDVVCNELIRKEYKESITIKEALKLGIRALSKAVEDLDAKGLDCAYIDAKTREFVRVPTKEVEDIVASAKKAK
ncbi:MAG TPA: archaeal proteasome endopeptidase complex subunit alpha [Candidatus Nanoarchaeia archaeon]|nr:archaeal proteasome endopeptidase complex subunit alpha [Candidatus Nanoarchaeia archaeon]